MITYLSAAVVGALVGGRLRWGAACFIAVLERVWLSFDTDTASRSKMQFMSTIARPLAPELAGAICGILCIVVYGMTWNSIVAFVFCTALLLAAVIDAEVLALPDTLTIPFMLTGIAVSLFHGLTSPLQAIAGAIAGYLLPLTINNMFLHARGAEPIGDGDAKLLAGIGAWLGCAALPQVIFLASVLAMIAMSLRQKRSAKAMIHIPYGPFLAVGSICTVFAGTVL